MNNISVKQRMGRIVRASVVSAVAVLAIFATTQLFNRYFSDEADGADKALRLMNRSEASLHRSSALLRGYIMQPTPERFEKFKIAEKKVTEYADQAYIASHSAEVQTLKEELSKMDKDLQLIEDPIVKAISDDNRKEAERLFFSQHVPRFSQGEKYVEKAREATQAAADQAVANRDRTSTFGTILMVLALILGSAWVSVLALRLTKTISETLENISLELGKAAKSVQTASGSVSTASQALSESTTQQAAAIEETVSSMEEMASMLSQTSQNTVLTMNVSEDGQQEGERGKVVISKMLTAMDEIHASNGKLEGIVQLIEQIKSKTKVINDIVFETRLLSFNASIEAARAGAQGKGFAVVAEEVGKLAAMSGTAAEEIRTLLESSTIEVTSVVKVTQERVLAGRTISQDCEQVFGSMSDALSKVGEAVRMITAATKEQEQGVKQTNKAMAEMDQVTQKNSAGAEALASQANHLSQGATMLIQNVDSLKVFIFGNSADGGSPRASTRATVVSKNADGDVSTHAHSWRKAG